MYFPKLTILNKSKLMNEYLIKQFDNWLASQSEMYTDYLNPLEFIEDCGINKKLGLSVFALSSSDKLFKGEKTTPLLRIKYIVDCPFCNGNVKTYYDQNNISNFEIECQEDYCEPFNPSDHPERINIFFELLDEPIIKDDDILQIYEKKSISPLTAADEDIRSDDLEELFWKAEEGKIFE
ncbi:hypothetical protein ACNRWW_14260 [Metabacillus sp. HB246100]